MTRIYLVCVCVLLLCWQSALTGSGHPSEGFQQPPQAEKTDAEDPIVISLEIRALETLRAFKATAPQLQKIAQLAKTTKGKAEQSTPARVSADCVNALKSLRSALVANNQK